MQPARFGIEFLVRPVTHGHDHSSCRRDRTVDRTFDDHKAYYPGATSLRIRLTGDQRDGRLLGAQLLGRYGAEVSKRADVYATALYHHMTVDELTDLDLTYTPPLSSPWDPAQMAALAWELERRSAGAS